MGSANFIQNHSKKQYGRTVLFESERVNAQRMDYNEIVSFSVDGQGVEIDKKYYGEVAHLYRDDGRVSNIEIHDLKISTSVGGQNKVESKSGDKKSPLYQIAMFYDTNEKFVMADTKVNEQKVGKIGTSPALTDMFGKMFGSVFENLSFFSGLKLEVGRDHSIVGEYLSKPVKSFVGLLQKSESEKLSVNFDWSPRFEHVDGDNAVFQCRKSEASCKIWGQFGDSMSGEAVCDGRFVISIKHSVIVDEEMACTGWLKTGAKRIEGTLQSRREMAVIR